MLALVVIMLILLAWALVAGRLARFSVTMPFAMLAAGVALTAGPAPVFVFDIDFEPSEHVVEGILAILLFTDATEVPGGILGRQPRLTLRLLLIALPLSVVAAWLAGAALFGGSGPWFLLVLAAVVMPVDLAPAIAVVRDRRIPERLRQVINAESGLNDGLIAPVFLFALAGATPAGGEGLGDAALHALPSLVMAIVAGAVVGAAAARVLHRALASGWTQSSALRIGVLALPLLAYGAAVLVGGNGFVAAFVAGVFFEPEARRLPAGTLHLVEDVGTLLSLALWFIFGAIVNHTLGGGAITWQIVLYSLLALTVARVLPVVVALIRTDVSAKDRVVLGWAGPRGIATLVFGMLAFIELEGPEKDQVLAVTVVTVVASIVVHGLSTGLVARHYGRTAVAGDVGAGGTGGTGGNGGTGGTVPESAAPGGPGPAVAPAERRGSWARWWRRGTEP
ncbi:cation:proton antiporter [Pseudonocardia kujensis]|uniref:cation:proton antiporter domain-containing protein n=1 Tax=Pseudonocardia kujensis TaxID=1128675 RepID=UPI001E2FE3E9|nr:cation:proton antiporter [Pseudonocardia kujensis]MCE0766358.1 cation:proton antiporter [Pseudonocardia kujensis]